MVAGIGGVLRRARRRSTGVSRSCSSFGVDDRRFVLATIWGTVGVIGIYVASRTVGLPMTPPVPFHGAHWVAGQAMVPNGAKYVGPLDVLTLAAEMLSSSRC